MISRAFCLGRDGYYNPALKHGLLLQPSAHINAYLYACHIHTHTHTHNINQAGTLWVGT